MVVADSELKSQALELLLQAKRAANRGDDDDAANLVSQSVKICETEEGRVFKKSLERYGPGSSAAKTVTRILTPGLNHYRIMGVARDAGAAQIKKQYKELSLEVHPDRNRARNAEEAFKRLGAAFSVLGNKQRRAAYDLELARQERGERRKQDGAAPWGSGGASDRGTRQQESSSSHQPGGSTHEMVEELQRELNSLRAQMGRMRRDEMHLRKQATMGQRDAQAASDQLRRMRAHQAQMEKTRNETEHVESKNAQDRLRSLSEQLRMATEANLKLKAELSQERQAKKAAVAESEAVRAAVGAIVSRLHAKAAMNGRPVAEKDQKQPGEATTIREDVMRLARALATDLLC